MTGKQIGMRFGVPMRLIRTIPAWHQPIIGNRFGKIITIQKIEQSIKKQIVALRMKVQRLQTPPILTA